MKRRKADASIMQAESELKTKADEWDELMCKTYHIDATLAGKLADKDYQLSDLRRHGTPRMRSWRLSRSR